MGNILLKMGYSEILSAASLPLLRVWYICSLLSLVMALPLQAQAPAGNPLAFEVASIKPSDPRSDQARPRMVRISGNHVYGHATLFILISTAYGIEGYQLSARPSWVDDQFYELDAKAEGEGPLTRDRYLPMLRNLLADRFQLKIHRETRELPVYALIVDKGGPKMKASAANAAYSWRLGRGQWRVTKVSMTRLAGSLTPEVDRTVVDLTGLAADYDFTLDWSPEQAVSTAAGSAVSPDSGGPSIFTALQEQLGLKLEPRKHPIDMLIVDHVERPSAN